MTNNEGGPLFEFDKDEWFDVMKAAAKSIGGDLTRDEFEPMWADFCEMKRRKQAH